MKTLGQYIKEYRIKNDLTQDALAELCGLSGATISTVESGKFQPTTTTIMSLAEGIKVSVNKLKAMPFTPAPRKKYNGNGKGTPFKGDPGAAMLFELYNKLDPDQKLRLLQQAMEMAVGLDLLERK